MGGKRYLRFAALALLIGFSASIFAFFISSTGLFRSWELKTYDLRMLLTRKDRIKPSNVVMFYVDEASLRYMEKQGANWPWPREMYSMALDFCRKGGARAVVFDVFYSEPSVYGVDDDGSFARSVGGDLPTYFVLFLSKSEAENDDRLATIIKKSQIPFMTTDLKWLPEGNSFASLPIVPLAEVATGFGNAQLPPDEDGIYRRIALVARKGEAFVPSLALKVASDAKKASHLELLSRTNFIFDDTNIPLDDDGKFLINYYGGTGTFSEYPLASILVSDTQLNDGQQPELEPAVVKDKIVVIGLAAPGLYDMKSSPFSSTYPGSEVHSTIIENLLTNDFIMPTHRFVNLSITILCGITAATVLAFLASTVSVSLWLVLFFSAIVGSSFGLFSKGIYVPLVAPVCAYALSSFTMILYKFLVEGRKKREIRRAFGQYLSPDVVAKISDDPRSLRLGGEERELTIFFSDIADFTTISEKTTPTILVEKLNRYFSMATKIIQDHAGTLDKYIGDAIMAFWGAPLADEDHAACGVLSALAIQRALAESGDFKTRIGIHTGRAVVGNIGSNIRFNYTAIGDGVNLASRLEGLNKNFGTRIIISEFTFVKVSPVIEARRIGRVRVKGRAQPVGIYEPLGLTGDYGPLDEVTLTQFSKALQLFENKEFKKALEIFEKLAKEKNDNVSASYEKLCRVYKNKTPEDFDGVVNFLTK